MLNALHRTKASWKVWIVVPIYSCVFKGPSKVFLLWLSSYYAVSLAAYILYPFAGILQMSKGTLTALVTLPILLLVWWAIRRIRKRME